VVDSVQEIGANTKPFTIYLADLRYFTAGTCFPLSIGYLSAYIGKELPEVCDVRLFINSEKLLEAIREAPPDLLGFANYSWNRNINTQVAAAAKSINANTITVMGGPCFARGDQDWLSGFFARNQGLDFYIAGAGEFALVEMIKLALGAQGSRQKAIRLGAFPSLFFMDGDIVREGKCVISTLTKRNKNLDEIPSPYLLGILDEFFAYENLGPMIETLRGCPYACTFCCWGSRMLSKVSMFSVDRVKAELDYVAERSVNCVRLFFGDANFGIVKRDVDIAEHLLSIREQSGWPNDVFLYFAKNSGERVIEISSILKGMTNVSMSRQSMNETVLANTKRANLDDESYARILEQLGENNVDAMVELIYPLPGETRESFVNGLEDLFKQVDPLHTEIRFYPTEMLPGSELASTESRAQFGLRTGWRCLSGHSGEFAGISACEYQEIVVTTADFTMADQMYVRKLHFLFAIFLTYRLYSPVMKLYIGAREGCGPMYLMDTIIARMSDSTVLGPLMGSFETDTSNEFLYNGEPPADGSGSPASTIQKRYNIHYILVLFYGDQGTYRAAFANLLRDLLINDVGIEACAVDHALSAHEANLIDYNAFSLQGEGVPDDLHNHPAVRAFLSDEQMNVVEGLYGIYSGVGAGHLERLLLRGDAEA